MESEHKKTSWHFCGVCKKYFQDKALLDKHLVTFHKRTKCYECDYVSEDAFDLSNHVRVAHMGMPRYDFIKKEEESAAPEGATGNVPQSVPEVILPDAMPVNSITVKSEPMAEEEDQSVSFLDADIESGNSNAKASDIIVSDPIDVSVLLE